MGRDGRKQQLRKEKRNKRAKEKKKASLKDKSVSPFALLAKAESSPFVDCCINRSALDGGGIGNLLVSRSLPNGKIVHVIFLVDLHCLGIKNVVCGMVSQLESGLFRNRIYRREPSCNLTPEEAKKLVVEAAAYAARYGLRAHEDYAKALAIFHGVDATECPREFVFGQDGKPFYVNGPNDSAQFQRRVCETLLRTAGPGGYDFLMMVNGMPMQDWDEFDDDEFEEDDEFDDEPPIPIKG